MEPLLNIAVRAARAASTILRRFQDNLDRIQWNEKSKNDFISEADKASEKVIIETIKSAYPDHAILAEESGLNGDEDAAVTWIIDPIDGTTNFIHGIPHFAISIGVQIKGKIEHAVVYAPMNEELFTASRGAGAELNNHRLRVRKNNELEGTLLATGFPFKNHERLPLWQKTFDKLFAECADIRRAGSAALDLAYVASGRLDGFWEFDLKPWDIAAGSLLVQEAGGIVEDFTGNLKLLESGNVLAANPKVFKAMLQKIRTELKA